jgi:hypothetical protein
LSVRGHHDWPYKDILRQLDANSRIPIGVIGGQFGIAHIRTRQPDKTVGAGASAASRQSPPLQSPGF